MITKRNKNEIEHFTKLEHIWWGARTPAGQKRYGDKFEMLKKYCGSLKGKKVLEIGGGDGEFTKRFKNSKAQVISTDITPEVINRGKKHLVFPGIKIQIEDACNLSFRNDSFDIVCGVSILHHVDTLKALMEAYRVLKKGGKLFFTEPNLFNPNIFLGLNIPYLRKKMEYSPDETAFSRFNLSKLLENAGFSKIEVRNYDFLHPLTPKSYIVQMLSLSRKLEQAPLIKEISGSLIVYAEK
jgi:2-polyprenyl-3-methyl-5-hydroxy-6-metoxy-1,4-benzoquinol methylase